jgi:hypothetical protein
MNCVKVGLLPPPSSFICTTGDGHKLKEGVKEGVLKHGSKQDKRVAMDEACSPTGEDDFQA